MNRQRSRWLAIALVGIGVSAVPVVGSAESPQSAGGGGEIIDGGTFSVGPPEHIDPALNTTLNSFQFINAVFDGLTEIDDSDPENIEIVPHLAESFESNEDATEWTFVVKEGQQFSDGEPILPSTFKRSWERAAALAGDYSYLMNFIEGGEAAVAGEADEITGVVADDEAMTLTVTLSAPYANFPALAGFQTFMPTPEAAVEAADDWENQLMVGNGPYAHGVAAQRPGDRSRAQRRMAGRRQRRDLARARRANRAPDQRRRRHVVQRSRGGRDRHRSHPGGRGPRRRGRIGAPRST